MQTLLRPRTALPRTDPIEAKDRNARGQGPKTQAQVLSKRKKSSENIFKQSPEKDVFQKIFQVLYKLLTTLKIVLSSSRGQANFRGLEAKDLRGQGLCPRVLHLWYLSHYATISESIHFFPYQV